MDKFYWSLLIVCLLVPLQMIANNREDSLSKYDKLDAADLISASFSYQQGEVVLGEGVVLQVPAGYRFLDAAQSKLLVAHLWGNPENPNSVGLLLPARVGPMDKDVWGLEVSLESSGYVSEKEARHINYANLLQQMKEDIKTENDWRRENDIDVVTTMQWAFPPYFDKKDHTLHWARILHFSNNQQPVLNYEMRILSRKGALCFNAIAAASQLENIRKLLPELMQHVHFKPGSRYTDYNPITDLATIGTSGTWTVSDILSPEYLLLWLRNTWSLLLVSSVMVLFVYAMQLYHRRRTTHRKMIRIDESLN
ncbi:DUF2167 domain-containing protein [Chitinophaga sp. MM2321]|uniref:DUF2167 domain-containing protein n=1 Tax=Chitinophaga sp. MM2321 TaxID=3137178 RepID=UPI0032D59EA2